MQQHHIDAIEISAHAAFIKIPTQNYSDKKNKKIYMLEQFFYLKVEDYGPYQPQGELWVPVSDIVIPDIDQFHLQTNNMYNEHLYNNVM